MTLPDDLPTEPGEPDAEPSPSAEAPLGLSELRVFTIAAPVSSHFTEVGCAVAGCPEYRYGLRVDVDPDTPIGQQQINHVEASGYDYTSWWDGTHVALIITRGQDVFTHWQRLAGPFDYSIKDGDAASTDVGGGQFLTQITDHLSAIADTAAPIRIPRLVRDPSADSPEYGMSLAVGNVELSESLLRVDIAVPLDTSDTSRPQRLASLADFHLRATGIWDRTSTVDRNLHKLEGQQLPATLTVGQWSLSVRGRFRKFSRFRPATNLVAWRLVIGM